MELDELLGLDGNDRLTKRARALLEADRKLLADLVQRRKDLGLKQAEVARRMDISQSAVARIESGARDLHQSTLRRYAMAVDVMVEHVVVADDPARERSARILGQLGCQVTRSGDEAWEAIASTDGRSASALALWAGRAAQAQRTRANA